MVVYRFAGSGTTANTLAFLFYAVASDNRVYKELKKELHQELTDWPHGSSAVPNLTQLQNLPYTNAVILEALRRYPTIPGIMPRTVTALSIELGGFRIPRGVS
jgi:benzoate 4-monooxygenase